MVLVSNLPPSEEEEYIDFPLISFPTPSEIDADLTNGLSTEDEAIEQLSRLQ